MKKIAYIFLGVVAAVMTMPCVLFAETAGTVQRGATLKLPYQAGESFVVTQGYNSPPTHVKKDLYAIDFSQNGCDAYGKSAVAATGGTVILAETADNGTGYGVQILVDHGGDRITRYAHLQRDSLTVSAGDAVPQGTVVGKIGDTGLVAGNACANHPGTHLHFALYNREPSGTYDAVKPEPISGYTDITDGNWYRSDNEVGMADTGENVGDAAVSAGNMISDAALPLGGGASNQIAQGAVPYQMVRGIVEGASTSAAILMSSSGASSSAILAIGAPTALMSGGSSPAVGGVSIVPGNSNLASINSFVGSTSENNVVASSSGSSSVYASSTSAIASSTASDASSTASSTPFCTGQCGTSSGTSSGAATTTSLFALDPPSLLANATSAAGFNSSTFAINLAWQAPANASGTIIYDVFDLGMASTVSSGSVPLWIGTSTVFSYPFSPNGAEHHFGVRATDAADHASTLLFASAQTPNWLAVVQPYDGDVSYPSWYSDTWYNLGTGFYGTVRSLTLNGFIDNPDYFATHIWLDEFLDASYTVPNQTFSISDSAPFTATSTLVAMNNLNVPLQPNKYYRLRTYQDYQNRSVILRGTAATGTAMANGFINGTGRVEDQYQFYPYLAWTFVPNWPPLLPPNPPPNPGFSFDVANLVLSFSWGVATDPDTASNLLSYQVNVTTSTSFNDAAWQAAGKTFSTQVALAFPNSYHIGVRAVDDLGNVSPPTVADWNFPAGYFPVPSQLNHASIVDPPMTEFHIAGPISMSAIALWTGSGGGPYRGSGSYLEVHADAGGAPGALVASSLGAYTYDPNGEAWHRFVSPVTLPAGDYWIEGFGGGCPTNVNTPIFYGSNGQLYFRLQTQ
jgi:hypothetical protein